MPTRGQIESGRNRGPTGQTRTAMLQPPRLPMVNGSTSPVWNYPLKSRKTFFDDGHGAPLPPTMVRLFSTRDTRIREAQECESKVPLPFCLNRLKIQTNQTNENSEIKQIILDSRCMPSRIWPLELSLVQRCLSRRKCFFK